MIIAEAIRRMTTSANAPYALRQQPRSVEIDRVHDLSTSKPSADFDTHGRSLPVESPAGSSLPAHGSAPSRPSRRHSRVVLTFDDARTVQAEADDPHPGNEHGVEWRRALQLARDRDRTAYDCELATPPERPDVALMTMAAKSLCAFPMCAVAPEAR
jgi:hypothetical protein